MSAMRTVPGAIGNADLAALITQLAGLKILQNAANPAVTASSVSASTVLADASSSTAVTLYGRYAGVHGNSITVKVTKSADDANLFSLDVWFPDTAQADAQSFNNTTDQTAEKIIFPTAGGHGYKNGDGPFTVNGTAPAGLTADVVPYWVGTTASSSSAVTLHTTKANALAATSPVNLTGNGTSCKLVRMKVETFTGLSMDPTANNFVEYVLNKGNPGLGTNGLGLVTKFRADGQGSEYVKALRGATVQADPRPSNAQPTLAGAANGQYALTGVLRGDHVLAAVNLTSGSVIVTGSLDAIDKDFVNVRGTNVTSGDKVVWVVAPR